MASTSSSSSSNTIKIEHYLVGKTLGVGASGKVKRSFIILLLSAKISIEPYY